MVCGRFSVTIVLDEGVSCCLTREHGASWSRALEYTTSTGMEQYSVFDCTNNNNSLCRRFASRHVSPSCCHETTVIYSRVVVFCIAKYFSRYSYLVYSKIYVPQNTTNNRSFLPRRSNNRFIFVVNLLTIESTSNFDAFWRHGPLITLTSLWHYINSSTNNTFACCY